MNSEWMNLDRFNIFLALIIIIQALVCRSSVKEFGKWWSLPFYLSVVCILSTNLMYIEKSILIGSVLVVTPLAFNRFTFNLILNRLKKTALKDGPENEKKRGTKSPP